MCCSCCLKDAPGLPVAALLVLVLSTKVTSSERPPKGLSPITPVLCPTLFRAVPTSCHDKVLSPLVYLFPPPPVSPWGQGLAGHPL